jgi:hypothetical protein
VDNNVDPIHITLFRMSQIKYLCRSSILLENQTRKGIIPKPRHTPAMVRYLVRFFMAIFKPSPLVVPEIPGRLPASPGLAGSPAT